jgi:hypothetical protein
MIKQTIAYWAGCAGAGLLAGAGQVGYALIAFGILLYLDTISDRA